MIYVCFYINCSEELDRCGVCFAKLIKHHVSACLVLHLIFTLRKLLVVTTCLFLTECFFWSYRKSWALLLIVSKPLSITWKYSVTGTVLFFFSYSSLLKQLFLCLNTFSSMTRSMSGEDGANSSSKQSNPRKYLEEEYLQTEKKVILLTILALLTDDKHALLIEENRDFSYNRHHQPYLQKDF